MSVDVRAGQLENRLLTSQQWRRLIRNGHRELFEDIQGTRALLCAPFLALAHSSVPATGNSFSHARICLCPCLGAVILPLPSPALLVVDLILQHFLIAAIP